jgi:SH3-like domain-containing protein
MKKFLLIILLLTAFIGCKSLEEKKIKVEVLNKKLIEIQNENSESREEIENYRKKIEHSKKQLVKIQNNIEITKGMVEESDTVGVFHNKIPENIQFEKKYQGKLPELLDYVFVRSQLVNLREKPSTISKIISHASYLDKLPLIEEVVNRSGAKWYKVLDSKGREVYVHSSIVRKRSFRFNSMLDKLNTLDEFINQEIKNNRIIASIKAYTPNPNSTDLKRKEDRYGNVEDQSALGYNDNGYLHISDRTIISIEDTENEEDEEDEEKSKLVKINVSYPKEPPLHVYKDFITKTPKINSPPKKSIVIDINNQNFGVFEKNNGQWTLISYAYSKTGLESKMGFKTQKGFFIVPNAKKIMLYNSHTGEKQGYAKYAIRFSGGGYIHATPFNYDDDEELTRGWKEGSLGTYPGTRKCVRNEEEHAKFLFDWILGDKISNTNYQDVNENISVIVF